MEFLYHYYEKARGPFRSVSEQIAARAKRALDEAKMEKSAAEWEAVELKRLREAETMARECFLNKGGYPVRKTPHYMIVGACEWLAGQIHDPAVIRIHISEFDTSALSFTVGDLRTAVGQHAAGGKGDCGEIYTYNEILDVIRRRGLPQVWNESGRYGPQRYIEVQIWVDEPVELYRVGLKR